MVPASTSRAHCSSPTTAFCSFPLPACAHAQRDGPRRLCPLMLTGSPLVLVLALALVPVPVLVLAIALAPVVMLPRAPVMTTRVTKATCKSRCPSIRLVATTRSSGCV